MTSSSHLAEGCNGINHFRRKEISTQHGILIQILQKSATRPTGAEVMGHVSGSEELLLSCK